MFKNTLTLFTFLVLLPGCKGKDTFTDDNIAFVCAQTEGMLAALGEPSGKYPRTRNGNGSLRTTDIYGWTSGFFPGMLWYLYEYTNDEVWKERAEQWTAPIEPNKDNTRDHDVGFMTYCSFGNGLRLTGNDHYRDVLLQTANSLITRYNPAVQSIKSWEGGRGHDGVTVWEFPVIIDNMMNLELLFWASRETGDPKYYDIAVTHANTTLRNHVRPDWSTYHVVDYDPVTGEALHRMTAQGYSDNSTWSRGQAWGVYGFTMVYRETGVKKYLDAARRMADFFLDNPSLPADMIPYWDFNVRQPGYVKQWEFDDTQLEEIPRDASAAAILSSALFELADHSGEARYREAAITILRNLSSGYRAEPGENANFVLTHCTGSLPHGKEIDVPLTYADYYFTEALVRYGWLGR